MFRLYRLLIRSKLDYGCIVYGSARNSYLQMLDPIHNQGLRLCIGAFRTSPVESLYIDAHKPSLGARSARLSLQYAAKIKSLRKHLAHLDNKYMKLFDARPSAIRIKQILTDSNIPVYTDGSRDGNSVACATVFPSDTELSMRLPDSASIFKSRNMGSHYSPGRNKKCICIQIYNFYRLTFMSPSFVIYEARTSLNWDGNTKVCLFKYCK